MTACCLVCRRLGNVANIVLYSLIKDETHHEWLLRSLDAIVCSEIRRPPATVPRPTHAASRPCTNWVVIRGLGAVEDNSIPGRSAHRGSWSRSAVLDRSHGQHYWAVRASLRRRHGGVALNCFGATYLPTMSAILARSLYFSRFLSPHQPNSIRGASVVPRRWRMLSAGYNQIPPDSA